MASAEPHPPRAPRARRWAAALLAVLLPAVVLRSCVVSTYLIRSPSMEPTLQEGDHLLVLRTGIDPTAPQRWDVALFDDTIEPEVPADVDAVVKRIVGLGGEFIEIRSGDLYMGTTPEDIRLVRKPDELVLRLLVPVSRTEGLGAPWVGPAGALVDGARQRIVSRDEETLFYAQAVRDGHLGEEGEALVADTAVEVVVGPGTGALVLRLREGADTFSARLAASDRGGAVLHHNLGGGRVAAAERFAGLAPGQRVLFWNVDNGVRLFVDEVAVLAYDYGANTDQTPGTSLNNVPAVGVDGGELEIRTVTILRDLHHGSQGEYGTRPEGGVTPCKVLPDQLFLLGDCSHRSRDSRHFGPVGVEHLLGRPVARYRPWDRAGRLERDGLGR